MVTSGSPVTIWCQGSLQADAYHLYKEGFSDAWAMRTLEDSSNRTGFPTESASYVTAGQYQCAYHTKRNGWSEHSDLLSLVVTGKGWGHILSHSGLLLVGRREQSVASRGPQPS